MQTRQLGNSDLRITSIGLGAWAMGGNDWSFGWGAQDDSRSIEAIHRALDLGINWIDTAAVYGLGHSEEVVAKALAGRANRPYVFTKCALAWNDRREVARTLKADSLRHELEGSLKRLHVDTIDLYQIHWPTSDPEIEEGWAALNQFRQEGKVRWIGVSNFNASQLALAAKIAPVTSLQPPYSAVHPDVEKETLPYCAQHNIGVIAYSPMQSGLLSGRMSAARVASLPQDDWRSRNADFKEPRLSRNLALADLMGRIGQRHGKSAAVVAIAWTLRLPAVTAAIVGARDAGQVEGFIEAAEFRINAEEIAEVDRFLVEHP